ncbi:hypothetical protein NQ314_016435 [Rhamnusium bicolor]|uniref:Uncharacterized protein n=1 Tax=Rhamnusium bicolor TaxID=1586634 RepID=A0AAV8WVM9_9CUCU|nr:hypothetical protein NQ314_016435 [Rhamnusium bicolor]
MESILQNVIQRRNPDGIDHNVIRGIILHDIFDIDNPQEENARDNILLRPVFSLEDIDDRDVKLNFRFNRDDIPRLCQALRISELITTQSGYQATVLTYITLVQVAEWDGANLTAILSSRATFSRPFSLLESAVFQPSYSSPCSAPVAPVQPFQLLTKHPPAAELKVLSHRFDKSPTTTGVMHFAETFSIPYPNRLCDLEQVFQRSSSALSDIINFVNTHIYDEFRHLLDDLDSLHWLNHNRFQQYAEVIVAKGARVPNCWGFIDGTIRPICRPSVEQEDYYSGHKRVHCINAEKCLAVEEELEPLLFSLQFHENNGEKRTRKRIWVKEWIAGRPTFGAYAMLLEELRSEDPKQLKNCLRISETVLFTAIIKPKERLALTLRFLATGKF